MKRNAILLRNFCEQTVQVNPNDSALYLGGGSVAAAATPLRMLT